MVPYVGGNNETETFGEMGTVFVFTYSAEEKSCK